VAQRILMVDDEPRVLDGLRRNLASRYALEVALSGAEGLQVLKRSQYSANGFAVVVSDMMMPGMNGAEFLAQAKDVVPDAVMMILSGQADLKSTIAAVNSTNLFRFIDKPCSPQQLRVELDSALRQYQLIHAERELLQRTLSGVVSVLADALAMASPGAGGRSAMVSALVDRTARRLKIDGWELRMAARLTQLGLVSIPTEVLQRVEAGAPMTPAETTMYRAHPGVAQSLLGRIPRMERVAAWVGGQVTDVEALLPTITADDPDEELPRQVLTAATEFLAGRDAGERPSQTAYRLTSSGLYDPAVIRALRQAASDLQVGGQLREVKVEELRPGMRFEEDVVTVLGVTLVRKGDVVTEALQVRLNNFATSVGVVEPIRVLS
jgi:DNA-binding response OmpR family regulator